MKRWRSLFGWLALLSGAPGLWLLANRPIFSPEVPKLTLIVFFVISSLWVLFSTVALSAMAWTPKGFREDVKFSKQVHEFSLAAFLASFAIYFISLSRGRPLTQGLALYSSEALWIFWLLFGWTLTVLLDWLYLRTTDPLAGLPHRTRSG